MTRHMVEAFELEDFSFEEEICAQYGEWNGQGSKSLKVYVVPYLDYMHYKLYVNKELVAIYPAFEAALIGYNDVCAENGEFVHITDYARPSNNQGPLIAGNQPEQMK